MSAGRSTAVTRAATSNLAHCDEVIGELGNPRQGRRSFLERSQTCRRGASQSCSKRPKGLIAMIADSGVETLRRAADPHRGRDRAAHFRCLRGGDRARRDHRRSIDGRELSRDRGHRSQAIPDQLCRVHRSRAARDPGPGPEGRSAPSCSASPGPRGGYLPTQQSELSPSAGQGPGLEQCQLPQPAAV